MGITTIPDIRKPGKATISLPSLLLAAIGLASLILAFSFFAEWNGDWRVWALLVLCVAALAAFTVMQLRMAHPLVEVRTFTYPEFTLGSLTLLLSSGSVLGLNFMLPILLQRGMGMGSMGAAIVLLPGAIIGAIAAPFIGGLLKRHFPPVFIVAGFCAVTVTDVLLMLLSRSMWPIAILYVFFMAASGCVLVSSQTHALNQLPARMNADGSAVMNTLQQLAGAIGTSVASAALTEFSNTALDSGLDQSEAYLKAFPESHAIFLGFAVVGLILTVALYKCTRHRSPELIEVQA